MIILKYKKIFLSLATLIVLASVVSVFVFKLNPSIEFTGGSLLEFSAGTSIEEGEIRERLGEVLEEEYSLRHSEETYVLRTRTLTEEEKDSLLEAIVVGETETVTVERFNTIGPTLGSELQSKALVSLALVLIIITFYIAYAFRKVSHPVSSWKYGLITLVSLIHDLIIVLGIFAYLGYAHGVEIDSLFITALLVILAYSINDTVVVFDRVRENLSLTPEEKRAGQFESIVGNSLMQTLVRSLNTTFTTVLSLVVIYFLTIGSVQNFALALIIGVTAGAYSSVFIGAPLLTYCVPKKKAK